MARRRKRYVAPEQLFVTGNCPSGKREFLTRAAAKAAIKQPQFAGRHMRVYLHDEGEGACNRWHFGHANEARIRGHITAAAQ